MIIFKEKMEAVSDELIIATDAAPQNSGIQYMYFSSKKVISLWHF